MDGSSPDCGRGRMDRHAVCFHISFLYVKYSLNPDMTPATMEKIIKENPKDICEIEQRLNRRRVLPGRNDSDFQSYMERLERTTARYAAEGKLTSLYVNWYCGNKQAAEVKYIAGCETRTAWEEHKPTWAIFRTKRLTISFLTGICASLAG